MAGNHTPSRFAVVRIWMPLNLTNVHADAQFPQPYFQSQIPPLSFRMVHDLQKLPPSSVWTIARIQRLLETGVDGPPILGPRYPKVQPSLQSR